MPDDIATDKGEDGETISSPSKKIGQYLRTVDEFNLVYFSFKNSDFNLCF